MSEIQIVKFVKADRGPQGCYAPGDIAGFDRPVAERLVRQGFAVLHDAGRGIGKVNPDEIKHLEEPFEEARRVAAGKGRAA